MTFIRIGTPTVTVADASPDIDRSATTENRSPARRSAFDPPKLSGPIDHIAIMGDSLYFESLDSGGRDNTIIPLVRWGLRSQLNDPDFRVRNMSRPGLAIKYPLRNDRFSFIALADWVPTALNQGGNNPDLVVIAATSIDLNLKQDIGIDQLATELVNELRVIVAQIEALGMQVVITPAFAINDAMYDGLKSLGNGRETRCGANARVSELNRRLNLSGLPMLFAGYSGLDNDHDGDADETNFVGFHPEKFPDDGVHTNAVGEQRIADHITRFLLEALP